MILMKEREKKLQLDLSLNSDFLYLVIHKGDS